MFLEHEHGSLLTKVVMFEIIFSIYQQLLGEGTIFLFKGIWFFNPTRDGNVYRYVVQIPVNLLQQSGVLHNFTE